MVPLRYPLNTDVSKLPFSAFPLLIMVYFRVNSLTPLSLTILEIWQIHAKFISHPSIEYWYPDNFTEMSLIPHVFKIATMDIPDFFSGYTIFSIEQER